MKLLARIHQFVKSPYRLNTTILLGATVMVALLAGVYSAIAYERLARETLEAAKSWSNSVAKLVSTTNSSALILNDIATIESNLLQVAMLPGIDNIAVYRVNGRMLTQAFKSGDGVRSSLGGSERVPVEIQVAKVLQGSVKNDVYESWSGINSESEGTQAWVRVQYSLKQRSLELDRLWHQSLWATALLVGLLLLGIQLIVSRAIKPIRLLSSYAENMPNEIGSQIQTRPGCVEVNQLGLALNQASRAIAEQIGRTQAIVNTAAEAIVGLDGQGLVATINPAASSFFGRPESDLKGKSFDLCIPGLNLNALHEMFGDDASSSLGASRIVRQDFFGTRADGGLFPVEISLGRVPRNEGLRYVCIIRDVTDERAAQEFTELYERALDCSHNAVFITNGKLAHQPIVYVNGAFQKMMGLPPHKILGGSMAQLLGGVQQGPGFAELALAVQEQRNANVTLSTKQPDGRKKVSEVSISPVRNGDGVLTHFVGIISDVTARVEAEEAIAERRAQLDAIFSLSPDGFVMFDANECMVFANPAFERMTGLTWAGETQPISLNEFEVAMTHVCDATQVFPSIRLEGDSDEPWAARLNLTRPQIRVVQAQSRRNTGGRGETILYFRDVTHEDTVDRMKSEFLAAAAHELRTPMVSIFGFTELLLKRKFSEERRVDMLDTIHRQSGLLVKMINELLDLARIESRRGLDLKIEAHSLGELVVNSVKGLMRQDTDRQVTVGPIPDVPVMVDPEKMQLAMNNLLSNAFKYSPQGGEVTLNANVQISGGEQFAVVEVSDRGMGMTAEQLSRAFERFYRADASGNIPGTGLGLSMVKEVAELHKGKVELTSQPGQGTKAILWIPLSKEKQHAESVLPALEQAVG